MKQNQFLTVIDRDEAWQRFCAALRPAPLGTEEVALFGAAGRVVAEHIHSLHDVPGFDRSNMDGYAVQAEDTYNASEEAPRRLRLNDETIMTGVRPRLQVHAGTATAIATGAMLPRGADAVVLVEATDEEDNTLLVRRAVTPGVAVTFAGTDIARGELVLFQGDRLTARETAVLAAIGRDRVRVYRKPRVAIVSTGNEIIPPGGNMAPGLVFDSNARALADSVREQGGEPHELGIVGDDEAALAQALERALSYDLVLLSGGTSKGPGDVAYRVLKNLPPPGVLVHGVALKPGKPLCLAAAGRKGVVVLPGFPTSALFTFHEFVAPVIRRLAGRLDDPRASRPATLPVRVHSERGRTEFLLVNLVAGRDGVCAWPMGKGSGSVTTFSHADGFCTIPRNREILEQGSTVEVTLLSRNLEPKDLVVIGSHCVGLDILLAQLRERGFTAKVLNVGSEAGLNAAREGQCDLAGIHLFDPSSGRYNTPFVDERIVLHPGYGRMQGVLHRPGDERFAAFTGKEALAASADLPDMVMINRNRGSGTRALIDLLLGGRKPTGYAHQARTHNAVAAAIVAGRADLGVAIATVAADYKLAFLPLREEQYDFVVPKDREQRPAVRAFLEVLGDPAVRSELASRGFLLERS